MFHFPNSPILQFSNSPILQFPNSPIPQFSNNSNRSFLPSFPQGCLLQRPRLRWVFVRRGYWTSGRVLQSECYPCGPQQELRRIREARTTLHRRACHNVRSFVRSFFRGLLFGVFILLFVSFGAFVHWAVVQYGSAVDII